MIAEQRPQPKRIDLDGIEVATARRLDTRGGVRQVDPLARIARLGRRARNDLDELAESGRKIHAPKLIAQRAIEHNMQFRILEGTDQLRHQIGHPGGEQRRRLRGRQPRRQSGSELGFAQLSQKHHARVRKFCSTNWLSAVPMRSLLLGTIAV